MYQIYDFLNLFRRVEHKNKYDIKSESIFKN